jgi:hypothetical protein
MWSLSAVSHCWWGAQPRPYHNTAGGVPEALYGFLRPIALHTQPMACWLFLQQRCQLAFCGAGALPLLSGYQLVACKPHCVGCRVQGFDLVLHLTGGVKEPPSSVGGTHECAYHTHYLMLSAYWECYSGTQAEGPSGNLHACLWSQLHAG